MTQEERQNYFAQRRARIIESYKRMRSEQPLATRTAIATAIATAEAVSQMTVLRYTESLEELK